MAGLSAYLDRQRAARSSSRTPYTTSPGAPWRRSPQRPPLYWLTSTSQETTGY